MEKTKTHARFRSHVYECIDKAQKLYDVDFGRVTITFDIRGNKAAEAGIKPHPTLGKTFFLRFNKEALEKDWEGMVESTIPHEVAHLVAYADPTLGAEHHNRIWRRIAIKLGDREHGSTCHTMSLTPARRSLRYIYINDAGKRLEMTQTVHKRIQKRIREYICVETKAPILPRHYVGVEV